MHRPLVAGAAPAPSEFPDDLMQPSEEESAAYSEKGSPAKPSWPSMFRSGGGGGGGGGGNGGGGGAGRARSDSDVRSAADVELGVSSLSTGYHRASDDDDGDGGGGGGSGMGRRHGGGGGKGDMGVDHGQHVVVWPLESNLDLFYNQLYTFWKAKGWASTVAKGAADVLTLGFTILFSTFMLAMVRWSALTAACHNEATCGTFEQFIDARWLSHPAGTLGGFVVFLYFLLFAAYWCFAALVLALYTVPTAGRMHAFYTDVLRISARELTTVHWSVVVEKLGEAARDRRFLVASADQTSPLSVANRIMRKENFLVAFFNEERLLDIKVPGFRTLFMSPLTQNLLYACVLNEMFSDGTFALRASFRQAARLRRRFVRYGLLTCALLPFLLIFMTLQFFLKHAHDWKSGQAAGGASSGRAYSPAAKWRFREYNELEHVLELRLGRSVKHANVYGKLFPHPTLAIAARGVVFVTGALLGLLAAVSVLNEDRLLFMSLGGRQLFFYGTVLGAIFAGARSLVPIQQEYVIDPEVTMKRVASHTHYFPRAGAPVPWAGRCHTHAVKEDFNRLFQHKIMLFVGELISVVWTPWLLLVSLPAKAGAIVDFVLESKVSTRDMGDMCKFATFDFEQLARQESRHVAAGHVVAATGSSGGGGGGGGGGSGTLSRAQRDKMQKSCLNFAEAHPDWRAGRGAADFIGGAARYAAEKNEARARAQAEGFLAASLSSSSTTFGASAMLQPGTAGHMALFGGGGSFGGGGGSGSIGSIGSIGGGALSAAEQAAAPPSTVVGAIPSAAQQSLQPEPARAESLGGTHGQEQAPAHAQPGQAATAGALLGGSFSTSSLGASSLGASSLGGGGGSSTGASVLGLSALGSALGGGPAFNPLLLQTITESAHENNFYWLEERLAAEEARHGLGAAPPPAAAAAAAAGDGYMESVDGDDLEANAGGHRTIV